MEDVGSCSVEIIRRIIPVTEQHYSAEGNDDDKNKYSAEPSVLTVTKVEESSAFREEMRVWDSKDPDTASFSHSE